MTNATETKRTAAQNDLTELVFILDRSGSMCGQAADTIGGFNSMLEKQKAAPGRAYVSTVLFDDRSEVLHDRLPLDQVPPMTGSITPAAPPRCWTPSAGPSGTLATSTSMPGRRTCPPARCFSSPPTGWKTPAAATAATTSGG